MTLPLKLEDRPAKDEQVPYITGDSEGEWKPEFAAEFNRRLRAIRTGKAKLIRLS